MIVWSVIAVLIVILDQISKLLVVQHIGVYDSIPVIPGLFEFVYVKNTGAAFSIMNHMTWLLGLISVVFCVLVVVYVLKKKPQSKWYLLSLTLLFGGALGNGIDRIFRGYVVDFIKTSFIDFPVFNVADIAITTGAVMLIIYVMKSDGKNEVKKED